MNKNNQYISTYSKDYTWPDISSICRTEPPIKPVVIKDCRCSDLQRVDKEGDLSWSRMGPMGRLLEPKIYPKIERVPKADMSPFDQPLSICVRKENIQKSM